MTRTAILAALLAALLPGAARAADLAVEPGADTFAGRGEGRTYPLALTVRSGDHRASLRAMGSGIRTQLVFDVYEGILYVDGAVRLGPDPAREIAEADVARRLEMHHLHSVDSRRYLGALESGFDRVLGDAPRSTELASAIERFMAAFGDQGVKENDVVAITWLPGAGLFVTVNGKGPDPIDNAMLASTVMAMWLGAKPVNETLKQDLIRLAVGDSTHPPVGGGKGR